MGTSYLLARMLIQSTLSIMLVWVCAFISVPITNTNADMIVVAAWMVGTLFISRIAAVVMVFALGLNADWLKKFTTYIIVVLVSTAILLIFAPELFSFDVWWMIAIVLTLSDWLSYALLWGAGARPTTHGEIMEEIE